MTEDQKRLCDLIDGHCEAMKAQVVDPQVKTQYHDPDKGWTSSCGAPLFSTCGPSNVFWHRLAPVPRLIPLDQSDFLGANRVTHLRLVGVDECCLITAVRPQDLYAATCGWIAYTQLDNRECSRDNGATWSKCEKPAP